MKTWLWPVAVVVLAFVSSGCEPEQDFVGEWQIVRIVADQEMGAERENSNVTGHLVINNDHTFTGSIKLEEDLGVGMYSMNFKGSWRLDTSKQIVAAAYLSWLYNEEENEGGTLNFSYKFENNSDSRWLFLKVSALEIFMDMARKDEIESLSMGLREISPEQREMLENTGVTLVLKK